MTPLSKQELRKQILSLCDKLREHVDLDHPDPDMTRPCRWPSDTTDEIMALLDTYCEQREVEAQRAKMVELRNQWGTWLDDHGNDKHTIKEIVAWLDREINWFDKKAKQAQAQLEKEGQDAR